MKKFPSLGFLHGNKRNHFAGENEMASVWGKFAITILYLWSAELTPSFIKYEVTVRASGVHR